MSSWSDKMKMSEERYEHAMRYNFQYQYYRLVENLLDSGLFIDRVIAKIMISINSAWYWLFTESTLSWTWFKINQMCELLHLRKPIDFNWEFWHWAPTNYFATDLDSTLLEELLDEELPESLNIDFDLDLDLDLDL